MSYRISTAKNNITAEEFINISQSVGWGKHRIYEINQIRSALKKTSFIVTIRDNMGQLLACGRVLSDNMFFTTIPDIFVLPNYQSQWLWTLIMKKIIDKYSHTKIFFGSQPGNEQFFEKLWFKKDLQSYGMKR